MRCVEMLDRWLARAAERLVLTLIRKSDPAAVVLPHDEYDGYRETLDVLDDAEAKAALAEGEADVRKGRVRDYEEVRRDLDLA